MKISDINKLRKKLLEENEGDIVKQIWIERYVSFLKLDSNCDKDIRKDGTTIWTENATQRFAKTHPSVETKLEIANEIEKLEVLIGIAPVNVLPGKSPPDKTAPKKSGLI